MLLMIAMSALSACGAAATEAPAAPEEPAVPEAPAATEAPAEPVEPSEQYPVQYGQDTRMEPFQHSDTKLKEMASVAIFVPDPVVVSGIQSRWLAIHNEMSELAGS
jgi:hypothetical protein